ncbi:MAG: hypothetical protein KBD41_18055 [Saprospiraceae bacterium]|nr:hypothetical protein [Saprospiraceae bacterium]
MTFLISFAVSDILYGLLSKVMQQCKGPLLIYALIQIVAVTYFLLIPPDTLEGYYYRCIFLGFCARVLGRVDYEQCRTVWHQYPGNGGNLYSESDQGYYHPCNPDFLHAGKIIWADHHWSDNWVFFNWYLYHQYFLVER